MLNTGWDVGNKEKGKCVVYKANCERCIFHFELLYSVKAYFLFLIFYQAATIFMNLDV